jgi:hypothetical protein
MMLRITPAMVAKKHCAGKAGCSGGPVVTNAHAFYSTCAAAGATGTRLSLRPLFSEGECSSKTRALSAQRECEVVSHRHCEERSDEAIHSYSSFAAWIASQSLSSGAHSRDPLARNDVVDKPVK